MATEMQKSQNPNKHGELARESQQLFSRQELSRVYVDDDGHVIAVFKDDSEMDITDLFNVVRQS